MVSCPKKTRLKSPENRDIIRSKPCLACDAPPPSDPDHLITRGAGGGDELTNMIPLCRSCHTIRGMKGLKWMAKEFFLPISWESGRPVRTDLN